jgi:hypothetical protein
MTQELSITTFRYVPSNLRAKLRESEVELHLDALNRELVDRLQRGGETFISNAVVGGHYLLRACIVNFHTTQTDVEAVPDIVDERPDTWVTLKMLEARVGFEPPRSLSTRKLFNPRSAQNGTIARIAWVRYTAGHGGEFTAGCRYGMLGRPYSNRRHPVAGMQTKVQPAVNFSSLLKNSCGAAISVCPEPRTGC